MVQTRKRFGQHFLEPAWADKVVKAIAPTRDDVFLEIGPGPGILTLKLAPLVAKVMAIEIDRDLVASLAPKTPANTTLLNADVLQVDLAAALRKAGITTPVRIAGNLPYNISSPILFKLLDLQRQHPVTDATVMLQREVANRLVGKPGTADYGILSVLIQWRADVSRVLDLPSGAFRPPPAVRSAVARLTFRPPTPAVMNEQVFERMVRTMFSQRRKTLGNALAPFGSDIGLSPAAALRDAGIDPSRRAETLEIVEIARLADVFAAARR